LVFAPADLFFFKLSIMKSCALVPVIGAITAIGPNNADKGGDFAALRAYAQKCGRVDAP
jgi:hypothetical protein